VTDQGGQAEALVQGASGPIFYNWNTIPAQLTSIASDLSSGISLVRISAPGACPVTDTALIVVDNNCGEIRFPSGFTPNRDGKNDGFGVLGGLGSIVSYRLSVYNRWGQVVFMFRIDCRFTIAGARLFSQPPIRHNAGMEPSKESLLTQVYIYGQLS
jgi:hypothetical protein